MKKRKRNEAVSTYLGAGVSIEGTISFTDTIRLDGNVRGKIVSDSGTIIIGEKAVIYADVSADVVIIMGKIHGTVEARERIEAYPPGYVSGDIKAPVISVEPGVIFDGNVMMKGRSTLPETAARTPETALPLDKAKRVRKVAENL